MGPPQRGATTALGLVVNRSVAPPIWAGAIGFESDVFGDHIFAQTGNCVVDRDAQSGRLVWSSDAGTSGVVASPDTLVSATFHSEGGSDGSMAYGAVNGVVAIDPADGRVRWRHALAADGQSVPAVVAGRTVVVSEADGAVMGLAAATGQVEWVDRAPRGCPLASGGAPGLAVNARLVDLPAGGDGARQVIVSYDCADGTLNRPAVLMQIDARNGRTDWRWQLPRGWSVESWAPAASTAGVLEVLAEGPGTVAPLRQTYPGISGLGTQDAVTIDETTGRPLWQVDGLPSSGGVYAGGGELCVASQLRVDCRHPRTGGEDWQLVPGTAPPADSLSDATDEIAAAGGVLYDIVGTRAAPVTSGQSMTAEPLPGAFRLEAFDMRSGQEILDRPLPAWYGSSGGTLAALDSPPGVVGVADRTVLVSPDASESDTIEAFPAVSIATARPPRSPQTTKEGAGASD